MCLNSNGRIYIAAHVNFNKSSFHFKTDSKFMSSKQNQLPESVNSFSKFIIISFPSENHSHEAITASSNFFEHPILDFAPSDYQNSDNSQNQTNQVPYNVSNIHSETQNTSDILLHLKTHQFRIKTLKHLKPLLNSILHTP